MKSITLKLSVYLVYAALLTIALLYYRFPSCDLQENLKATAKAIDPRLLLDVEQIRPALPFVLKFSKVKLSLEGDPEIAIFGAENIIVRPQFWSILAGEFKAGFECTAYGGNLEGNVHINWKDRLEPLKTRIKIRHIQVENWACSQSVIGCRLEGLMDGNIEYAYGPRSMSEGTGSLKLSISKGQLQLRQPLLGVSSLDIQ